MTLPAQLGYILAAINHALGDSCQLEAQDGAWRMTRTNTAGRTTKTLGGSWLSENEQYARMYCYLEGIDAAHDLAKQTKEMG